MISCRENNGGDGGVEWYWWESEGVKEECVCVCVCVCVCLSERKTNKKCDSQPRGKRYL